MSRRQHTRLILSVEVPVPQGWTQMKTLETVRRLVCADHSLPVVTVNWAPSVVVKLSKKETTYL